MTGEFDRLETVLAVRLGARIDGVTMLLWVLVNWKVQ